MKNNLFLAYRELQRNPITTLYSIFLNGCMMVVIQFLSAAMYSSVLKSKEGQGNNNIVVCAIWIIMWVAMVLFLTIVYKVMRYTNRRNYRIYYTLGMGKREIKKIIAYKRVFFCYGFCCNIKCCLLYFF